MENLKTYKLFLDDIRNPLDAYSYTKFEPFKKDIWRIVRNYNQFTDYIKRNYDRGYFPDFIAFDHDLALEHYSPHMNSEEEYQKLEESFTEKTGMDCAKWLVEFCIDNNIKLPDYYVHSMNPVGNKNIRSYLENYKKHC